MDCSSLMLLGFRSCPRECLPMPCTIFSDAAVVLTGAPTTGSGECRACAVTLPLVVWAGRSPPLVFQTCLEALLCRMVLLLPSTVPLDWWAFHPTGGPRAPASSTVFLPPVVQGPGGILSPAPMGSVDCWPLVSVLSQIPGGLAGVGSVLWGVPRRWSPSWKMYVTAWFCRPLGVQPGVCGGPFSGKSAGAIWMALGPFPVRWGRPWAGC